MTNRGNYKWIPGSVPLVLSTGLHFGVLEPWKLLIGAITHFRRAGSEKPRGRYRPGPLGPAFTSCFLHQGSSAATAQWSRTRLSAASNFRFPKLHWPRDPVAMLEASRNAQERSRDSAFSTPLILLPSFFALTTASESGISICLISQSESTAKRPCRFGSRGPLHGGSNGLRPWSVLKPKTCKQLPCA